MLRLLCVLACLYAPGGSAVAVLPSPAPETVIRAAATDFYRALHERCSGQTLPAHELYRLVDEILMPHADFASMSRWVLGKYWKRASMQQRQDFAQAFKRLLIRTYATAARHGTADAIVYLPVRPSARPDRQVVRTEVRIAGAADLPIHYYMHLRDGKWLVYDVRIEGVSLVSNYRSSFATEIGRLGIQGLIDKLEQNNNRQADAEPLLQLAAANGC